MQAIGLCTFRPKFLGQIWGYPKYPRLFWGYPRITPDFWGKFGVTPPKKGFIGAKKTLPQIFGVYPKNLELPQNYPRFLGYTPNFWGGFFLLGAPCDHCIFEFWKMPFSIFWSCDRKQSQILKRIDFKGLCTLRPKFLGQIWGYPKYPNFFGVTPDLPQISGVNLG